MFCKHKWKKLSEVLMPSQAEDARQQGIKALERAPGDFFVKKLVIVLVCEKCGKVKKIVENNV